MKIKQQLEWATGILYSTSCSARLDSEVLLAFCLQKDRSYLFTWPDQDLTPAQKEQFHDLIRRRIQPQPVAYLTGNKEFYSMELNTTSSTLVPRPETEMLVDAVLEICRQLESPQILELGTGTGAISIAIKKQLHASSLTATDISQAALDVAQSNARKHRLDISFVESDWYRAMPEKNRYDVIVSNPPYIAEDDPYLRQGDLPAEPCQALCSGKTGLEALEIIISGAGEWLKPAGWIVLEHGYDQSRAVAEELCKNDFKRIETRQDFNDLSRMTIAQIGL